jgi:hypothetical protein
MNVEFGTEAAQFPEKDYINGIFFAVQVLQRWHYIFFHLFNLSVWLVENIFYYYFYY